MKRAKTELVRFPAMILWWAQVTETPEERRIAVFSKGTENGLIIKIPVGGQAQPISGDGAKLEWKKAQKNPKKKANFRCNK